MRVLCINGDFSNISPERIKYAISFPKELEEYSIREVVERNGRTGYLLEEVFGGILPTGLEVSWDYSRFVVLEEIDTLEEISEECLEENLL